MRTLVWFRGKDLRLADHEPLRAAAKAGEVVPVFVLDPYFFAPARAAAMPHRMQYLLDALTDLRAGLRAAGSDLLLVEGRSLDVIPRLVTAWQIDRVVAHRWSEPFGRERDDKVRAQMRVPFDLFEGETLLPPGLIRTQSGTAFSVYTPFARAFLATGYAAAPIAAPSRLPPLPALPPTVGHVPDVPTCDSLGFQRNPQILPGGTTAAEARLQRFCKQGAGYATRRDALADAATSRLSADLKFGTVSVRKAWARSAALPPTDARVFHAQLLWREFAHDLIWHRPQLLQEPFRAAFARMPWQEGAASEPAWIAWTTGHTGYPVVDAAARQLLATGYVENRARMIAASFLTKHLLIDYRRGEAHYARYLTDGDWALNNMGWQWSAGCGVDAQPYFRVFNPTAQGEKFDADGTYVRTWIPELATVPARFIHRPWDASPVELAAAGVTLGRTYSHPIVDHATARARFLDIAAHTLR